MAVLTGSVDPTAVESVTLMDAFRLVWLSLNPGTSI